MASDPLVTKVLEAVATTVAGLTPKVGADRVYVRPVLAFQPGRDSTPALIIAPTPGRPSQRRRTLSKWETVYPVTAVLADAQDQVPTTGDPRTPGDPEWRAGWWEAVIAGLHGLPAGFPDEVKRVSPDSDTLIDGTQFAAANLWWAAVSVNVMVRQSL